MKSSCSKEDIDKNNPSLIANQYVQPWQQRKNVESTRVDVSNDKSDKTNLKTSENFISHHSIPPCPFTFLTAVKRKLALGGNDHICKKVYEPVHNEQVTEDTMDFIKPLKVPDLKISPKADYSSRESLLSNEEFSKKIEAVQRDEMALKSTERVPRKLEFSSNSATSMLNYENVEPLKIPDLAVSKKKDLSRDSSKEKENRSKRVKKEDSNMLKNKNDLQDLSNWPKCQRHISRKEIADAILNRKLKNDRILAQDQKNSDILSKKSKNKTVNSVIKKDDDKRHKYLNIPSTKSKKDKSLGSRSRTSSSESIYPTDKGTKLHDKILIREGYKAMISEINDRKYKDDSHIISASKPLEEHKYKAHSETRLQKHQSKSNAIKPIETLSRDQSKRSSDKQKSTSRADSKHTSEISEDIATAVTSIASLVKSQSATLETPSSLGSKSKERDKSPQSSNRITEELKYSDDFSNAPSSNPATNSTAIETKLSQDSSLSEKLMDPMRISFRDESYSNQPEFAGLVTPDFNLMVRSKRRKQGRDNDNEHKESKQSPTKSNNQEIEDAQLIQLKAEMNLLDSFSESLRQVIDVDKSRLPNEELKRHALLLQNEQKDTESKKNEFEILDNKEENKSKVQKSPVKVVEVQTQTANDIATQTDTTLCQRGVNTATAYSRISIDPEQVPHLSLDSEDRYEDMDRVNMDISLSNKMRTMSEISLHETTSSIKTETGTEISISTRDVTCSFNKYLDLEMAQLIKDERQRYDKIEMLFKSREKTLNDRTKKLVKLEEQKRALRDTGQDSRISSVKKKQRALLLKLQQEKDEMNRLKELHKIASQERKLMLQKQRDMFNPEMSTKNILNKLKRSADSQSPRRLSGPMKGYDIRSNSSISSLLDSDKSQFDRSQLFQSSDVNLNLSDITPRKNDQPYTRLELDSSLKQNLHGGDIIDKKLFKFEGSKHQKDAATAKLKYDLKTRKFEEKMPKTDQFKLKAHQYDLEAILKHGATALSLSKNENQKDLGQDRDEQSISEHLRSESDAIIEEFAQIWSSQFPDFHSDSMNLLDASDSLEKASALRRLDKESIKRLQQQYTAMDSKSAKRKGTGVKLQKSKFTQAELSSKSEDYLDEAYRHTKRSKIDSEQQSDENYQNSILEELDFNESQSSLQALLKHSNLLKERNQQLLQDIVDEQRKGQAENSESPLSQKEDDANARGANTSARSQVSLTISHQSSNDSDRSYSRSVVIHSQQDHHTGLRTSKKLEQILKAREATLVSRRNCVEEWIAWHARLREEENRVGRMEQAAYKLVSATAKALSHNDTTISSDTSDVEGRIELLTQKLADRRLEMTRLKKEARKQAKQRLRALEANLLNQIKKYDATIHEMRKKLEVKKGTNKENEKLAIESKSIVDYKVPEIPIKRIQEIYKNSDLLRSKSDSDIISTKSEKKSEKLNDDKSKSELEKESSRSKSTNEPKPGSSVCTVYDDDHESSEKSDYSAVHSYKTKSNSEEIATQKSIITEIQEIKRSSSQSSNISEEIPSEAYSVKSQTEQVSTAMYSEAQSSTIISEKIEFLNKQKENSHVEEELESGSDDISLTFSRKLDNIQLHNKELNDDIHNLEHDLKELTEIMSNFSKKSEEKHSKSLELAQTVSKTADKSKSTDISEELPTPESINKTGSIDELHSRVNNILSDVIPETDNLVTSIEELQSKIRGADSHNEAKKSVISDYVHKSDGTEEIPTYLSSHNLISKNELSSGNNKNEIDIQKSQVSEVVSSVAQEYTEESATPVESQSLVIKESKLSEVADSSKIETELQSEFELSTGHVEENKEISANEVYTATEDRVIDTKISITEETFAGQVEQTSKLTEDKTEENEISTTEDISAGIVESSKVDEILPSANIIIPDKNDHIKDTTEEISAQQVEPLKMTDENVIENEMQTDDSETLKEISAPQVESSNINEKKSDNETKITASEPQEVSDAENGETDKLFVKSSSDNDWTLSESFDIPQIDDKDVYSVSLQAEPSPVLKYDNVIGDVDDSTMFIPKGDSTHIQDAFVLRLDESSDPRIGIQTDEFNDILEIIERETKNDDEVPVSTETLNLPDQRLEKSKTENPSEEKLVKYDVSVTVKNVDEESESIEEHLDSKNEASISEARSEKSSAANSEELPQIEIGVKIQLIEDEDENSKEQSKANSLAEQLDEQAIEIAESNGEDKVSSDGEQLDNLIEVAEGKLDTVEKTTPHKAKVDQSQEKETLATKPKMHVQVFLDKTFEVIKDPEYEDISEESLEVSEILDRSESRVNSKSKKFSTIPEKYVIKSKSDEVLRILDELSNKSPSNFKEESREVLPNENICEISNAKEEIAQLPPLKKVVNAVVFADPKNSKADEIVKSVEESPKDELVIDELKSAGEIEDVERMEENPPSKIESESSEVGLDTPRGISEIDMDSPRDVNDDSRLDVDALDDDLLSGYSLLLQAQPNEAKIEFNATLTGISSEKDIEAMIDKLKASLEQPGLEEAERAAKLLQIENLQIELEIKKLEAEEDSYYVREIPNKPPPPYTPPGAVRLSGSHGSPPPPPAVIPTNVEELTAITEKAMAIIFKAKEAGEDILALEAPTEICEIAKDNGSEALKKDRRIYNSFLFDLCKELVAEVYKSEYEKQGPSWIKPNVKSKPAMKLPISLDELNDYVSKEVATLFGFKTKLQRENMVMRWSRKRRDRVDELLAKEAQAEEKEWTKFHHDELTVKNELTTTILDSLIVETANCVKAAYARKRASA